MVTVDIFIFNQTPIRAIVPEERVMQIMDELVILNSEIIELLENNDILNNKYSSWN
jgi:propanediol dehydratase small subunit